MKRTIVLWLIVTLMVFPGMVGAQESMPAKTILPTSRLYFLVQVKEFIQLNLLTFGQSSKAKVLGDFADQRVKEIEYAASIDDITSIDLIADEYQSQTLQALDQVKKSEDTATLDQLKNRIIEQQKTITQTQLEVKDNELVQTKLVVVQKQIANQTKTVVNEVQGEDAATELESQVQVIWRDPNADVNGNLPPLPDKWEYEPGTQGRDDTGKVVIEGDASPLAPGTQGQGISEVEIEGDATPLAPVVQQNQTGQTSLEDGSNSDPSSSMPNAINEINPLNTSRPLNSSLQGENESSGEDRAQPVEREEMIQPGD